MKVIEQKWEWMGNPIDYSAELIESIGRTCYKSEDKISTGTANKFVRGLIKSGHHSVIEHVSASVKFTTDRAVSHELCRHRLASYSQESQRYCAYNKDKFGNEITFIKPVFFDTYSPIYKCWLTSMSDSEDSYFKLIDMGASTEEARTVLPNSTKTEIIMTANIREWRHVIKLRTSYKAYLPIRQLMKDFLHNGLKVKFPVFFEDFE